MNVVALVSGGKDSCYNMMQCVKYGHKIVAIANLHPVDETIDEIDSFMFQTVGHNILEAYSECLGVPIFRTAITGTAVDKGLQYSETGEDEVEDLFRLLSEVKAAIPNVQAVASGAILSSYQRLRVENVCDRLNLVSLAYLWQGNQRELLNDMVENKVDAILVKVAAMGLDSTHLGKTITELFPFLCSLEEKIGCNVCGEGGEYESLTLDCPIFIKKIVIDEAHIEGDTHTTIAPVARYRITKFHLVDKRLNDDVEDSKEQKIALVDKSSQQQNDSTIDNKEQSTDGNDIKLDATVTSDDVSISSTSNLCFVSSGSTFTNKTTFTGPLDDTDGLYTSEVACVLQKLRLQLEQQGFTLDDVFYVHFLLSDLSLFGACNSAYKQVFKLKNPPSRSCVQFPIDEGSADTNLITSPETQEIAKSVSRGDLRSVIVDCMAFKGKRRTLHVQSVSSWAPACIGPYSQASGISGVLFLAGQIGLDPATMKLVQDPIVQIKQCFWNAQQVLEAEKSGLEATVDCVVFVSYDSYTPYLSDMIREECEKAFRQYGKPDTVRPNIVYIMVPRLPRDALVEVRIIALVHLLHEALSPVLLDTSTHLEIPYVASNCNDDDCGLDSPQHSAHHPVVISSNVTAGVVAPEVFTTFSCKIEAHLPALRNKFDSAPSSPTNTVSIRASLSLRLGRLAAHAIQTTLDQEKTGVSWANLFAIRVWYCPDKLSKFASFSDEKIYTHQDFERQFSLGLTSNDSQHVPTVSYFPVSSIDLQRELKSENDSGPQELKFKFPSPSTEHTMQTKLYHPVGTVLVQVLVWNIEVHLQEAEYANVY